MHGKSFIDLLDRVTAVKDFATGDEFLKAVRSIYEARNIAYLCVNLPKPTAGNYYLHHSYSNDWARHYESNQYVNVDPVTRAGFSNILPTDWRHIRDLSQQQKKFLEEAREFGIGWQGLTVSVRGLHRETAIFSLNTDHSDTDWEKFKREYMRDIQVIATYFHQKIAESQGLDFSAQIQALTPREVECLKWCAAGKTYADTATILSITERTVIFHMTLARTKLNALTNAQAVAKAVHLGIVNPG